MTAGDVFLCGWLVSLGAHLHVLTDREGYPLQYEICGRVVPNTFCGNRLRLKYGLPKALLNLIARCALSRDGETVSQNREERTVGPTVQPAMLVSSQLRQDPRVKVVEDDILTNTEFGNCFDVIRAANILNRDYFEEQVLKGMINNLRNRLVDNGFLLVCRTETDGKNDATLFRLSNRSTLERVAKLGKGSEIEDLIGT